jgi:hypothetical protein
MLQLSIREFNKNISKALKTLPVEITLRGVVIARIVDPNGTPIPAPAKTETPVEKKVEKKKVATPKIAGERSSVKEPPPSSASPPPPVGAFPPFMPPPPNIKRRRRGLSVLWM